MNDNAAAISKVLNTMVIGDAIVSYFIDQLTLLFNKQVSQIGQNLADIESLEYGNKALIAHSNLAMSHIE
ncbi:MAG: methyl-accepting chemotaxis protein [Paraglaciecola sp.]|jgi:hypothetical protein